MATKGVELASAYISLSISTDGVPAQVEKALKGTSRTAERAGRDIGRKISDGASSGISDGAMSKALARELGSAGDKGSKQILRSLAAVHQQATRDASVAGRNYAKAMATAMTTGGSKDAAHKFEAEFRNALNAQKSSQAFFDEFHRDGVARGRTVGTLVGKAMGGAIRLSLLAATGGLAAAVGGIGFTLFKGFERYKSLDAAAKRLGHMGKTTEQVKTIMSDINEVVEGTPIALDAAAGAATKFLAGGVKEGKELKTALTGIADASAVSGTDFSHLADIFQKVSLQGELTGTEIAQLEQNLVPISAWLKDMPQLAEDGTVSFQEFLQAVEHGAGGAAKTAADTIDGAITQMQTSVARVGANFLSAIFGDPLSTTEGPGGMAEAINKVTIKINNLNDWVVANQGDIKQFFTDAAGTVKNLAEDLRNVGSWLVENKDTIATIGTLFIGWKVAGLLTDLGKVGSLLGGAGAGGKGGRGILGQLGLALAMAGGLNYATGNRGPNDGPDFGNQALFGASGAFLGAQFGGVPGAVLGGAAGAAAAPVLDFMNPPGAAQNGVLPTATGARNGQTPTVGGIPMPGLTAGSSWNPNDENTGGTLGPSAAAVQDYFRNSLGFTGTIGGWRPPDGFNEHSSGKALDLMVGSRAEGYALLPNALTRPGVEYVIWDNKMWYPDGTSKPYSGYGPNPTPTQAHMDHLHVKTFDQGGWLPPGTTFAQNNTGKPERILTPEEIEELKRQGIDPNTMQHGQAQGAPPGPMGTDGAQLPNLAALTPDRTEGYIPATAGNTGKTGGGIAGSLLNMGAEAIGGMIDMAASAASMGVGAMAPGAGAGIQVGAEIAKRGVQYAAEMGGIGIGALTEILLPFGAPRWLTDVNPTSFMPQIGVQPAAVTSGEKSRQDIYQKQYGMVPPGSMFQPAPGMQQIGRASTEPLKPHLPAGQHITGASPGPGMAPPKPDPNDPLNFLKSLMPFDTGGLWQPGTAGVNLTNRPEVVLTPSQWKTMEANASNNAGAGNNYYVYGTDTEDTMRALKQRERLNAMQYGGRPYG